ncbi:hypothetical protein ACQ858_08165 [Variovorax ureilyticus]|uniref:hypothetical protein n=1 Tax=Variovorax ureilyticus TaxID=1836198 RepID=UPI003D678A7B
MTTPTSAEREFEQTFPDHIWLDVGADARIDLKPGDTFRDLQEVTWSEDNATGFGVKYVRSSVGEPAEFEQLCREHEITGTALEAIAQVFWARGMAVGERAESSEEICPDCHGSGEGIVYDTSRGPDGHDYAIICETCHGSGVAAVQAAPIMRFNLLAGLGPNPDKRGLYVRYEDHIAALSASPAAAQPSDSQINDIAEDFKSQYMHGRTTFDEFDHLGFAHAVIAHFLEHTGQYVTNDASREACIKSRVDEALEKAAKLCEPWNFDHPDDWTVYAKACATCAAAVRELKYGEPK